MMLNTREWKDFYIGGEDGIFEISSTSSSIDKNKLNLGDELIPYITRTDNNNGISLFVPETQQDKYKMDTENVIIIGLDTQTVFYEPHKFYTGQNIQILKTDNLNRFNALFIIPIIKIQMEKFNWGGNGATLGRLARTKLMLPIDRNNVPDWKFMEDYIKEQEVNKKEQYKTYVSAILKKINYKKIVELNDKRWKEFYLINLFPEVQRGKRLTKSNQKKGDIPFVSSTALNNGIYNFISNSKNVRKFSNCISIANSGSVGSSFYEPFEFIASDHITHLKNNQMNKYIYLFIASMTNRLSEKYNFNREINDIRISREKIMLPINNKNEPDYEYMEQYMKNLMIEKYNGYLDYTSKEAL